MTQTDFGTMGDGAAVSLFTIAHPSGIQANVTNLGATLVSLQVPDRNGSMGNVVLGLPRAEDYLHHAASYFGAAVGRFANRIAGGRFALDGHNYQLNTSNARDPALRGQEEPRCRPLAELRLRRNARH